MLRGCLLRLITPSCINKIIFKVLVIFFLSLGNYTYRLQYISFLDKGAARSLYYLVLTRNLYTVFAVFVSNELSFNSSSFELRTSFYGVVVYKSN